MLKQQQLVPSTVIAYVRPPATANFLPGCISRYGRMPFFRTCSGTAGRIVYELLAHNLLDGLGNLVFSRQATRACYACAFGSARRAVQPSRRLHPLLAVLQRCLYLCLAQAISACIVASRSASVIRTIDDPPWDCNRKHDSNKNEMHMTCRSAVWPLLNRRAILLYVKIYMCWRRYTSTCNVNSIQTDTSYITYKHDKSHLAKVCPAVCHTCLKSLKPATSVQRRDPHPDARGQIFEREAGPSDSRRSCTS